MTSKKGSSFGFSWDSIEGAIASVASMDFLRHGDLRQCRNEFVSSVNSSGSILNKHFLKVLKLGRDCVVVIETQVESGYCSQKLRIKREVDGFSVKEGVIRPISISFNSWTSFLVTSMLCSL